GVTLHGFDEIGDEIVAALELHIDVRPGVVAGDLQPDEAVVHGDDEDHEENEDAQNNETKHWSTSFQERWESGNKFTIRAGGGGVKESRKREGRTWQQRGRGAPKGKVFARGQ